ncbi:MAG: hypothetical protein BM560_01010 [Roseobacter sp. MedPE-SWde]|nr:MAG: hypothetical protein BM560_01010 [Roseobacter sp. MedPE-SWde]
MSAQARAVAAAEIAAAKGLCKILVFHNLGGTLIPPSDDPSDWWEPQMMTHRAELLGIQTSGENTFDAVNAWVRVAKAMGRNKRRRATDGRPDCPYNGQGLAPGTIPTPAA